jgi:hypothetical protein
MKEDHVIGRFGKECRVVRDGNEELHHIQGTYHKRGLPGSEERF